MVYSLYVYTDNAGNDWAVSVPTDVAAALSMVAATTQPYLDETIAPRWANFRSASGLVRQAVIKDQTQFGTIIGTTITLGGVPYKGSSARGESTGALQPNLIQPPQALMGPPGPAGPGLTTVTWDVSSPVNVTSGGEVALAPDVTVPATGNYLVTGMVRALATSGTSPWAFQINIWNLTQSYNNGFWATGQETNYNPMVTVSAVIQANAGDTLRIAGVAPGGNDCRYQSLQSGSLGAVADFAALLLS